MVVDGRMMVLLNRWLLTQLLFCFMQVEWQPSDKKWINNIYRNHLYALKTRIQCGNVFVLHNIHLVIIQESTDLKKNVSLVLALYNCLLWRIEVIYVQMSLIFLWLEFTSLSRDFVHYFAPGSNILQFGLVLRYLIVMRKLAKRYWGVKVHTYPSIPQTIGWYMYAKQTSY